MFALLLLGSANARACASDTPFVERRAFSAVVRPDVPAAGHAQRRHTRGQGQDREHRRRRERPASLFARPFPGEWDSRAQRSEIAKGHARIDIVGVTQRRCARLESAPSSSTTSSPSRSNAPSCKSCSNRETAFAQRSLVQSVTSDTVLCCARV